MPTRSRQARLHGGRGWDQGWAEVYTPMAPGARSVTFNHPHLLTHPLTHSPARTSPRQHTCIYACQHAKEVKEGHYFLGHGVDPHGGKPKAIDSDHSSTWEEGMRACTCVSRVGWG
jgi:hypothetical protein